MSLASPSPSSETLGLTVRPPPSPLNRDQGLIISAHSGKLMSRSFNYSKAYIMDMYLKFLPLPWKLIIYNVENSKSKMSSLGKMVKQDFIFS